MSITATDAARGLAGVDERLQRFFDEKEALAGDQGEHFVALWAALRRASIGGKRIRPSLVLHTARELGCDRPQAADAVAAAFELLHTAFLLHDDVIDGDTRRRGKPNLIGEFYAGARSHGVAERAALAWSSAAGILAGDLLLHAAQALIARLDIDEGRRLGLLDLLDRTLSVTAAGELGDVALSVGTATPSLADALTVTRAKTAHYSFQAPLQAGAILAGAGSREHDALSVFGHRAGIAFQLRDDLLGVFGDPAVTGKSNSVDICRAKLTPLVAYALGTEHGPRLRLIMEAGAPRDVDVASAREILMHSGACEFVEGLIDDHVAAAEAALREAALPETLHERLIAIAHEAGARSW
ncbi:polyprenyl synthetase family protein [Microbacterium kribbense]|uniref:Polyprenyl synthetase family protein n=1 Tax=Microbacterium kribbense TaxID=433645 RepID=A0ABP7G0N0_9MICO